MSRIGPLVLILACCVVAPSPAAAEPPARRWAFPEEGADPLRSLREPAGQVAVPAAQPGCESEEGDAEIVVCGGRPQPAIRIPFERVPGERIPLIAGEAPSAMAALNMRECVQRCHSPVGISFDPVQLIRDPVGTIRGLFRRRP